MNRTMNATVQKKQRSADYHQLQQVNRPTPKSDDVLIKIHTISVKAGDVVMRKMPRIAFLGLKCKRIPGHELACEIVEVGASAEYVALDKSCPLEQLADAHHYVESGRKRGSLAINIVSNN